MANKRKEVENLEQRMLYEEYVKLGDGRSLEKLLPLTQRSRNTVIAWSKKFNWANRVEQEDKALMESTPVPESQRENKERKKLILDMIDFMIKELVEFNPDGTVKKTKVQAKNIFDLRTLIDIRDEQLGLKKSGPRSGGGGETTNIDKAVFIIKK